MQVLLHFLYTYLFISSCMVLLSKTVFKTRFMVRG